MSGPSSNERTNMSNSMMHHGNRQSGPSAGAVDPIQLHADAHNSLALAAYYLAKGRTKAAQRKLGQAMAAMRALDQVEA